MKNGDEEPDRITGLDATVINPNDASLDQKLALMANRVYKDVVVPSE